MNRREPAAAFEAVLRDGWSSACQLDEHLARGGHLVALPPSGLRLGPDEAIFSDTALGYARFYGTTVQYRESSRLHEATLAVTGEVIQEVTVQPFLLTVFTDQQMAQEILLIDRRPRPLAITELQSSSPHLKTRQSL